MTRQHSFPMPRMGRVHKIHFIGIGGTGMCGIAEVLHNDGYDISGSDISTSSSLDRLKQMGITLYHQHDARHIEQVDVVVRSTAIGDENPEVKAALSLGIPVIPRAMMLAELMRYRQGIAISGTHGKTTTTSLVSSLLAEGGLSPSFVIGGRLNSCGSHAQLGQSSYFVAEADESDASFLFLKPTMAVVTNIDADHMTTYNNDLNTLRNTFLEFLHHLPFYGLAILCIEDKAIRQMLDKIQRPVITYGFGDEADYQAVECRQNGLSNEFIVIRPSPYQPLSIQFNWPGKHNVLNALAAIAVATELGVSDKAIQAGLSHFQGVGRRFQILGDYEFKKGRALIVDDYGHHPEEIRSTIEAFRAVWPHRKLIHVFQPHRYSRTKDLFIQFVESLKLSDELLLLDIYAAGETPLVNISSETLKDEIKLHFPKVSVIHQDELKATLENIANDGDVVLMQGAGNIGQLALELMKHSKKDLAS